MRGIYNYIPEKNMFLGHIILQVYVVTIYGTRDTISNYQHFEFYSYISTF